MADFWTPEEEARRLAERFAGVNQAQFAREHGLPGGASMVTQHIKGHRPISPSAAVVYARGFGVPLDQISPRLAAQAKEAASVMSASEENAEDAGRPRRAPRPTPVQGTARLGDNGFYEQLHEPDGFVDSHSSDPDAYALRVKGDSMHPAIRHGWFVVVEPNGRCVVGEYVALQLRCGRKMVKELVIERHDEVVVESVNGNHRRTIERSEIESMCPVGAVVLPSKWRAG